MRVHETLLRRVMHLRTPEIRKLQDADYMSLGRSRRGRRSAQCASALLARREHGYSVLASPLSEDLPFSGQGSLRGHVAWVTRHQTISLLCLCDSSQLA